MKKLFLSLVILTSTMILKSQCLVNSTLVASPQPVNGTYQPGQTVNFCYTVTAWSQINTNWFHGVIPIFGNGWDLNSLVTTPANSCDGNGSWNWYSNITSSGTGMNFGPGFFYESNSPGAIDSDPGNNYGDNCTGSGLNWQFCWSITVDSAAGTGANLSVNVNTTADGESGVWSNIACVVDPQTNGGTGVTTSIEHNKLQVGGFSLVNSMVTNGIIQIKETGISAGNLLIEIYDVNGKLVSEKKIFNQSNMMEVETNTLAEGIFFVRISKNTESLFSGRFVNAKSN